MPATARIHRKPMGTSAIVGTPLAMGITAQMINAGTNASAGANR